MDIIVGRVCDIFHKIFEFGHIPNVEESRWVSIRIKSSTTYICKVCGKRARVIITRGKFWLNGNMFDKACCGSDDVSAVG